MDITATQFKAKCLGIIDRVKKEKLTVVISKHGQPAAELIPIGKSPQGKLFGRAANTTKIVGDILSTDEHWDAED